MPRNPKRKPDAAKSITLAEVKRRTRGLDPDKCKAMTCALVGHSLIVDLFFGRFTCARCGTQVGDLLGGIYADAAKCVIVGHHNCKTCRANFKAMDWRHTFLTPDPFPKKPRTALRRAVTASRRKA